MQCEGLLTRTLGQYGQVVGSVRVCSLDHYITVIDSSLPHPVQYVHSWDCAVCYAIGRLWCCMCYCWFLFCMYELCVCDAVSEAQDEFLLGDNKSILYFTYLGQYISMDR